MTVVIVLDHTGGKEGTVRTTTAHSPLHLSGSHIQLQEQWKACGQQFTYAQDSQHAEIPVSITPWYMLK